jgi:hypothetical protein
VIYINVVEFGADSVPIGLEVPLGSERSAEEADSPSQFVLYITLPRWTPLGQIDTLVNQLDDQYRESAELVVLRVHPQQLRRFHESGASKDLEARFPGKPLFVLSWSGEFSIDPIGGPERDLELGEHEDLLAALRHAEARALLERSGVVLPSDETFHYEGPNGRHYESFVRVGTAIQSIDALDGLAFWLLNWLIRSPLILLDSWTILSLGLNCERYLNEVQRAIQAATGNPDSHGDVAKVVAVECQRRYGEPRGRLQQRLVSLYRDHRDAAPPVLVLMSVSSTGESAKSLCEECRAAGFPQVESTSIFVSAEAADAGFCALPEITEHWGEDDCPRCDEGSQSVRVMPDTYLLDLAATVRSDVAIRTPHVQQPREFFERYGGAGVISLHRTQEDDQRHHMVFVDVRELLGQEVFRERLAVELDGIEGIDLVLCPKHRAGEELADLVAGQLGANRLAANPEQLLELDEGEKALLDDARRILVVDDIVMTGTRLRRYRNSLQRTGTAMPDDFELHFLAAVARPDSLLSLRGIVDYTHFDERFHYVELLVLPNWDHNECPWCAELKLLDEHGSAVEHDAILKKRRDALMDTASGLTGDLFLDWLRTAPPPVDPWQLGPNSIFGAKTAPELFAAVAHALQVLRSDGELNEHFTLPVARVLDRRFTMSGRFYDTVITACLLRATRRHDLRAPATDAELEAEVGERLRDGSHVSLQGELLFALYRRHLPGHRLEAITHALTDENAEQGIRQLLAEALGPS